MANKENQEAEKVMQAHQDLIKALNKSGVKEQGLVLTSIKGIKDPMVTFSNTATDGDKLDSRQLAISLFKLINNLSDDPLFRDTFDALANRQIKEEPVVGVRKAISALTTQLAASDSAYFLFSMVPVEIDVEDIDKHGQHAGRHKEVRLQTFLSGDLIENHPDLDDTFVRSLKKALKMMGDKNGRFHDAWQK